MCQLYTTMLLSSPPMSGARGARTVAKACSPRIVAIRSLSGLCVAATLPSWDRVAALGHDVFLVGTLRHVLSCASSRDRNGDITKLDVWVWT